MDDTKRPLKYHSNFHNSQKVEISGKEYCFHLHSLRTWLLYQSRGISNCLHHMGKPLWNFTDVIVKFIVVYVSEDVD